MHRAPLQCLALSLLVGCLDSGGGGSGLPTISNLEYGPKSAYLGSSGGRVIINGSFSFAGARGGVASVTISVFDGQGAMIATSTTPVANDSGATSGVIQGSVVASTSALGTFAIQVTLTDVAGRVSNELTGSFRVVPYPWVALTAMPTPRIYAAVAAFGSKFYVMGGEPTRFDFIPPPVLSTVEVFEATTATWSTGASLPVPREYLSAINVGGKIYVFGGNPDGSPPCRASTFAAMFDPGTNTWSALTAAPMLISGAAVAAIGTSIYVIGGIGSCFFESASSTVQVYDTAHDFWTTAASLPGPAVQLGAGALNGKIVEFGGFLHLNGGGDQANPSQSIYDPATNVWTVSPNGFVRDGAFVISDVATAVSDGMLYTIGGRTTIGTLEVGLWQFDPSTAGWTAKEPLPRTLPNSTTPVRVYGPMADSFNGQLYAFSPEATWVYTPPPNDMH